LAHSSGNRSGHGCPCDRRYIESGIGRTCPKLHISYDKYRFFSEAHPKLRRWKQTQVEFSSPAHANLPKDIPDTVSQASAAASKVLHFSHAMN